MTKNQTLRILIIEDEPRDADLIKRELKAREMSCETRVVDSRNGTLAALDDFAPDIILSDYTMPQFSGMEALELRNRLMPEIPFIVVTTSINEKTAIECIQQGADDYLTKDRLGRLDSAMMNAMEKKRLKLREHEARRVIDQSAVQWQTTFDGIQEFASILDRNGHIVRCNRSMQEFIAKPWREISGQPCCDLIHGMELTPENCPARRTMQTLKRESWETEIDNRWFDITTDPVLDEEGRLSHILHVMTDITKRRQADQALRASESKYRSLVSNIPGMIYYANPDWTVNVVSGSEDVCGYAAEELITGGIDWRDIIYPDDLEEVLQSAAPLTEAPGSLVQEYRIVDCSDEIRWVRDHKRSLFDSAGRLAGIDGVVFDISREKETVEELAASERRYRALFSGATEGILVIDIESRQVRHANAAICRMLGYTETELVGLSVKKIIPQQDLSRVMEQFDLSVRGAKTHFTDVPSRHKDGTVIPVIISTAAIPIDNRPCLVVFIKDISGLRQLETERKDLEDQLRQAQKLEAIGRLAGGIAHDFNNIIHAIKGFTSLAERNINDAPKIGEYLSSLHRLSDRASHLTRQLLAFSRKQALTPEVVDLNEFLEEELKILRRMLGEDITIRFTPGPTIGHLMVDRGQLSQILINLAVNSRDAMPEGGEFSIQTTDADLDTLPAADSAGVSTGQYVRISISDTGCGMDVQTLENIFDPFFTTKKIGEGTGLGLSTVHGIIKQHRGNILVESKSDEGTTFTIYLPCIETGKTSERKENRPLPQGTETILLVEDEESVRQIVEFYLEELGYQVISAAGADEAESAARQNTSPVHLLLTDVIMPGRNGHELYKFLLKDCPDLRVLYMSGYTGGVIERYGVLNDSAKLLNKPFTIEDLATALRSAFDTAQIPQKM